MAMSTHIHPRIHFKTIEHASQYLVSSGAADLNLHSPRVWQKSWHFCSAFLASCHAIIHFISCLFATCLWKSSLKVRVRLSAIQCVLASYFLSQSASWLNSCYRACASLNIKCKPEAFLLSLLLLSPSLTHFYL